MDQSGQQQQPTHIDETSVRAFCTGPLGLHLYALLRFITGVGAIGSFMVCFVLAVEHVGYKVVVQPVQNFLGISTYSSFSSQCLSGLPSRCPLPWERCCWGSRWRWMHWTSKPTKSRPTSSVIGEPYKWCPTYLSWVTWSLYALQFPIQKVCWGFGGLFQSRFVGWLGLEE